MTKTLNNVLALILAVFLCVVVAQPAAAQSTYGNEPLESFNRIRTYSVTVRDAPTTATTLQSGTLYRTTTLTSSLSPGNSVILSLNEPRSLAYRTVETTGTTLNVRVRVFGNSPWGAQSRRTDVTTLSANILNNPTLAPPDVVVEEVELDSSEIEIGQEVFAPGPLRRYVVSIDNGTSNDTFVINKFGIGTPFICARKDDFVSLSIGGSLMSPADPSFAGEWPEVFDTRTGALIPVRFAFWGSNNTQVVMWVSTSYQKFDRGIKGQPRRMYTLISD